MTIMNISVILSVIAGISFAIMLTVSFIYRLNSSGDSKGKLDDFADAPVRFLEVAKEKKNSTRWDDM